MTRTSYSRLRDRLFHDWEGLFAKGLNDRLVNNLGIFFLNKFLCPFEYLEVRHAELHYLLCVRIVPFVFIKCYSILICMNVRIRRLFHHFYAISNILRNPKYLAPPHPYSSFAPPHFATKSHANQTKYIYTHIFLLRLLHLRTNVVSKLIVQFLLQWVCRSLKIWNCENCWIAAVQRRYSILFFFSRWIHIFAIASSSTECRRPEWECWWM